MHVVFRQLTHASSIRQQHSAIVMQANLFSLSDNSSLFFNYILASFFFGYASGFSSLAMRFIACLRRLSLERVRRIWTLSKTMLLSILPSNGISLLTQPNATTATSYFESDSETLLNFTIIIVFICFALDARIENWLPTNASLWKVATGHCSVDDSVSLVINTITTKMWTNVLHLRFNSRETSLFMDPLRHARKFHLRLNAIYARSQSAFGLDEMG